MKSIQLFVRLLNIKLLLGGLVGFLIGYNSLAQAPNFGDDSSTWSQDGECDDPRFQGGGMAATLLDEDRFSDATDCRDLYNLGRITLSVGDGPVDFGDDSSQWSQDGECDDPRFQGTGMASTLIDADRFSDATDCRLLFNQGQIRLSGGGNVDFGDDSSQWSQDGECDDPRFQGGGMAATLLDEDRFSDATDCRLLFNQGQITLSGGGNVDFGDDSSQWSQDGECDDPRFQGTGMASTLIDADRFSDATDCRNLYNLGRITLRGGDTSPGANPIETSSGTGFFVSRDGHILTNQHVIDGCQEVQVHTNGTRHMVSVIAADRVNDLALLKSELNPLAIFPINRETPILLQDIYVAGYPFGDDISTSVKVTAGIVSSLSGIGDNDSNIQIDAALQPGNSGGPIIDRFGNAIGVAVEKLNYEYIMELYDAIPENTNFGIKASVAINLLDANNVSAIQPNYSPMSKEALGRRIIDGTVYVSCLE